MMALQKRKSPCETTSLPHDQITYLMPLFSTIRAAIAKNKVLF